MNMETFTNLKILDAIGIIYEKSKKSKLEDDLFTNLEKEITYLSNYFKVTKNQTFFISLILALNYKGIIVDMSEVSDHLDCNPMKTLRYNEDLNFLESKGILLKENSKRLLELSIVHDEYTVNNEITEAILKSLPMPEIIQKEIEDDIAVLELIYKLSEQRDDQAISTSRMFKETQKLIFDHPHFPFIKKIHQLNYPIEDTFLFLYVTWKSIVGNEVVNLSRALSMIYDESPRQIRKMQELISKKNILIINTLIEFEEEGFIDDMQIKLTNASLELLKECDIKLFLNRKVKKGVFINPSDIIFRELIFGEERSQLNLIGNLLQHDKFLETQEKLTQKGMPKGITILLHGAPGTGKTEIAKQWAKQTERELMKVDISESKSMWYGQSEKLIKKIFTDYSHHSKNCKRTPILLFNEADGLISKRTDVMLSNTGQTHNTIQNILLEELENFEGILIATTNLIDNLDSAFDRRFLFKVEFKKPDIKSRSKIWKLKLPLLETKECELLAEEFDFSGGQIDNIVRKNEILEIVNGIQTNYESIVSFCKEESLNLKSKSIGFNYEQN